jgi:methylenetetrahydrofolate--tRNA-(uracil-5-)-methyltransferase
MNVNFGLFPALETAVQKDQRKPALVTRARADLADWMKVA